MPIDSDFLVARDGLKLYYRYWIPEKIKKIVCAIHGHGEHSGRYHRLASVLMERGVGVYCLDQRGHGKSEGKRGHARNMDILLNDVEELLKAARVQHLELPIYLFGHSMGGNLVANYMITKDSREISGFILSAPWFRLRFDPPPIKVKTGQLIGKVWPSFSTKSGLDPSKLSRIKSEVEKYVEDPMIHSWISVALYNTILAGGQRALASASHIKKPGLIYHGTGDEIIDWKASEQFGLGNRKFVWEAIEEAFHEPHNDECREDIYQLVGDWIQKART